MDDLIKRKDAIDALGEEPLVWDEWTDEYNLGMQTLWVVAKRDIESLPSVDAEPQWIPCSEVSGEGYPKEDGFYYVTEQNYGFYLDADSKENVTHTSRFFNGDFTGRFYDENHSNIVAWMPLPKPYERGGS